MKPATNSHPNSFPAQMIVFTTSANVREIPNGPIKCVIENKKTITVYTLNNDWYKTDACGTMGYIHNSQVH